MEVRIVPEKLLDASVKNQEEVIHEVKAKLMEMKDGYSTDQILSIANLIDSDPMTECLVKLNRQQWDIMVDHFETQSTEDKRENFCLGSEHYSTDKIVKGKWLLV